MVGQAAIPTDNPSHVPEAVAEIRVNLAKKPVDAYNVIGILPGADTQLKNEAIIIGAHYDHLGHGGSGSLAANSTDIHHGADDNASGTSAVIELARQFAKEKRNKRTLIFMAFGGEEEGLLGSKYYVNNPVWPLDKTVAMINMDMVGRLNENKLTIGGIGTASEWKDLVEVNNKLQIVPGAPVLSSSGPKRMSGSSQVITPSASRLERSETLFALQLNEDGFGPSDHSSFYGKKIPVLFFFTGTHTDYHKPSDTADKINYEGLDRVTRYVGTIIRSVDANPTKPTYAVAKSSGPMGQVRLGVSLGTIPSYGDTTDGMILDGVRDNSPASKAGLKAGDKIVKLAGKDVRNAMDYTYVLGSMKPGEEYEVELIRGTERMTLKIIPAAAARRP
jgi:Zn-dependent M28 family amino/carboxypeptidase